MSAVAAPEKISIKAEDIKPGDVIGTHEVGRASHDGLKVTIYLKGKSPRRDPKPLHLHVGQEVKIESGSSVRLSPADRAELKDVASFIKSEFGEANADTAAWLEELAGRRS